MPLALGNRQLAPRGAALQGGSISTVGDRHGVRAAIRRRGDLGGRGFVDPDTGIVLRDISLAASIAGNRLVVDRLNAASGEGSVTATGSIGLDPKPAFRSTSAAVRDARYVDGTLVAARFTPT